MQVPAGLHVISASTGAIIKDFTEGLATYNLNRPPVISRDGLMVLLVDAGHLYLIHTADATIIRLPFDGMQGYRPTQFLGDISPDSRFVAARNILGKLVIYDLSVAEKPAKSLPPP